MKKNFRILYRINDRDEIVSVNGDWSVFAETNDAPELVEDKILNSNLWDYVSGATTQHLYQQILLRVRSGHNVQLTLRCDSPKEKRILQMDINLTENGEVEFDVCNIASEGRTPQKLLQKLQQELPREDYVLMSCSWCNKVEVAKNDWREVEDALKALKLFEAEVLPRLSHGMCGDCHEQMSQRISAYNDDEE